jgi:hypothetical protein
MMFSRCCLTSSALAVVLAGVSAWQFYAHIDQGVTLAYAETVSNERAQTIVQLRALAFDQLKGKSRAEITQLLDARHSFGIRRRQLVDVGWVDGQGVHSWMHGCADPRTDSGGKPKTVAHSESCCAGSLMTMVRACRYPSLWCRPPSLLISDECVWLSRNILRL